MAQVAEGVKVLKVRWSGGAEACWGEVKPKLYTTFNARTYLPRSQGMPVMIGVGVSLGFDDVDI